MSVAGDMERRFRPGLHAAGRRLEGRVAPYNVPAAIGPFTEIIRPGAFRASLAAGKDVLGLVDHDFTRLLGRTASGTLRLTEDATGLLFSLDVPDTAMGRDLLVLAERGDIGGMSMGFRALDEAWPTRDQRELRAIDLVEVSIVAAHPAYPETMVSARSRPAPGLSPLQRRRILGML